MLCRYGDDDSVDDRDGDSDDGAAGDVVLFLAPLCQSQVVGAAT